MQAKQILMFENRADLYDWLLKSDLAMSAEELKSNEKKKAIIVPQLQTVKTYIDYVNNFQCDCLQTMIWTIPAEKEGEKPQLSVMPVHVGSDSLTLPEKDKAEG